MMDNLRDEIPVETFSENDIEDFYCGFSKLLLCLKKNEFTEWFRAPNISLQEKHKMHTETFRRSMAVIVTALGKNPR